MDYILTHVAPTDVAAAMGRAPLDEERRLNDYLADVSERNRYSEWYFGHYHVDVDYGRFHCVYRKLKVLL